MTHDVGYILHNVFGTSVKLQYIDSTSCQRYKNVLFIIHHMYICISFLFNWCVFSLLLLQIKLVMLNVSRNFRGLANWDFYILDAFADDLSEHSRYVFFVSWDTVTCLMMHIKLLCV